MDGKKGELLIVAILAFIIILVLTSVCRIGLSETVYVACNPKSFVWARRCPKFGSDKVAYLEAGQEVETDYKTKGKWLHVFPKCEAGEGWLYMGYVVYDEPIIYEDGIQATTTKNKVFARRNAGGKTTKKMKKNAKVTAYLVSDDWSVTNVGFVKTEFLSFGE